MANVARPRASPHQTNLTKTHPDAVTLGSRAAPYQPAPISPWRRATAGAVNGRRANFAAKAGSAAHLIPSIHVGTASNKPVHNGGIVVLRRGEQGGRPSLPNLDKNRRIGTFRPAFATPISMQIVNVEMGILPPFRGTVPIFRPSPSIPLIFSPSHHPRFSCRLSPLSLPVQRQCPLFPPPSLHHHNNNNPHPTHSQAPPRRGSRSAARAPRRPRSGSGRRPWLSLGSPPPRGCQRAPRREVGSSRPATRAL